MKSWMDSANDPTSHFPLNNLPFGVFVEKNQAPKCCVAIGDSIINLDVLVLAGMLPKDLEGVFNLPYLNKFMESGSDIWSSVRSKLISLLALDGEDTLREDGKLQERAILKQSTVTMKLPFRVAEFTDFYAGKHHAENVGTMFRGKENALPPNWLHIPIGYNGRASTVVVSGTDIRRPMGQTKSPTSDMPTFGPCKKLDIELELGAVVGKPSEMGLPVSVDDADEMIFGYVILNDWSARDIQAWEYQPLGPFQAKAFATTISPWVVTREALEPFRTSTPERLKPLLPHLQESKPLLYDIDLKVELRPENQSDPSTISRTNYKSMYYSSAQQLAHHSSSGCKMNIGDLLGSGTISGPEPTSFGSLLELSWGGENPIHLSTGETRTFVEDGDELSLTGHSQGEGYRVGFGSCVGKILPALEN